MITFYEQILHSKHRDFKTGLLPRSLCSTTVLGTTGPKTSHDCVHRVLGSCPSLGGIWHQRKDKTDLKVLLILFITYVFIFETGSHYVALFVLELVI